MSSQWNKYADKSLIEETVANILLNLPWESDDRNGLKDKVLAIIDSYDGRQEEMRIICIHWLLSDLLQYEEKAKFQDNVMIIYKMMSIARYIMNNAIKKIDTHILPAQKH